MDISHVPEHVPVLQSEALALLAPVPGATIVDATLGGGGYTREILRAIGPSGTLIAFDWDEQAISRFHQDVARDHTLAPRLDAGKLILVQRSYSELSRVLAELGMASVDGVVADLGLSSIQLDDPERGLSFRRDGPLDMRLNSSETVTAADIVNTWNETALAELFWVYGDEGEAGRIARALVTARKKSPLTRTMDLAVLIERNVVPARRHAKVHPATKVFQALRMAVNSEQQHLEAFLEQAFESLRSGGRLIVVSFHSGEDGLVKQAFRRLVQDERGTLLTKKPIVPSETETERNIRARSAKLRGIEKL